MLQFDKHHFSDGLFQLVFHLYIHQWVDFYGLRVNIVPWDLIFPRWFERYFWILFGERIHIDYIIIPVKSIQIWEWIPELHCVHKHRLEVAFPKMNGISKHGGQIPILTRPNFMWANSESLINHCLIFWRYFVGCTTSQLFFRKPIQPF